MRKRTEAPTEIVLTPVVIGPNDVAVVTVPENAPIEAIYQVRDAIKRHDHGNQFLILCGGVRLDEHHIPHRPFGAIHTSGRGTDTRPSVPCASGGETLPVSAELVERYTASPDANSPST